MKRILSLLVVAMILTSVAQAHDIVLRKAGKAVLGVSYPAAWKQVVGENHVIAVSADGQAWSVISTLDDVKDHQTGIDKIKEGIEEYLKDVEYDKTAKTAGGALILAGTGRGKKTDVDIVFTTAVFESGEGQLSGIVFIVDADIEKYYEKTILAICKSVLVEEDFADEE